MLAIKTDVRWRRERQTIGFSLMTEKSGYLQTGFNATVFTSSQSSDRAKIFPRCNSQMTNGCFQKYHCLCVHACTSVSVNILTVWVGNIGTHCWFISCATTRGTHLLFVSKQKTWSMTVHNLGHSYKSWRKYGHFLALKIISLKKSQILKK